MHVDDEDVVPGRAAWSISSDAQQVTSRFTLPKGSTESQRRQLGDPCSTLVDFFEVLNSGYFGVPAEVCCAFSVRSNVSNFVWFEHVHCKVLQAFVCTCACVLRRPEQACLCFFGGANLCERNFLATQACVCVCVGMVGWAGQNKTHWA